MLLIVFIRIPICNIQVYNSVYIYLYITCINIFIHIYIYTWRYTTHIYILTCIYIFTYFLNIRIHTYGCKSVWYTQRYVCTSAHILELPHRMAPRTLTYTQTQLVGDLYISCALTRWFWSSSTPFADRKAVFWAKKIGKVTIVVPLPKIP